MAIGEKIRERRIHIGLGQTELADKVGISKQTLYKYENGIVTNIPSDKVEAIARALNTTPAYLMGWVKFSEDEQKAAEIAAEVTLSKELQEIIAAYRKLSDADKKTVYNLIQSLANR